MSQEIRTPMNAILGFTELLKRGFGRDSAETHKHLEIIHSSGKHLLELINDILDLSKVESCHLEIERIRFNPYLVIQEVVRVLSGRASEKGRTRAPNTE
jgi:signal transduction histidine kinase